MDIVKAQVGTAFGHGLPSGKWPPVPPGSHLLKFNKPGEETFISSLEMGSAWPGLGHVFTWGKEGGVSIYGSPPKDICVVGPRGRETRCPQE